MFCSVKTTGTFVPWQNCVAVEEFAVNTWEEIHQNHSVSHAAWKQNLRPNSSVLTKLHPIYTCPICPGFVCTPLDFPYLSHTFCNFFNLLLIVSIKICTVERGQFNAECQLCKLLAVRLNQICFCSLSMKFSSQELIMLLERPPCMTWMLISHENMQLSAARIEILGMLISLEEMVFCFSVISELSSCMMQNKLL